MSVVFQETNQHIMDNIMAYIDHESKQIVIFDCITMGTVNIPIVSIDDFTDWLDKELGFKDE